MDLRLDAPSDVAEATAVDGDPSDHGSEVSKEGVEETVCCSNRELRTISREMLQKSDGGIIPMTFCRKCKFGKLFEN